MKTNTSQRQKQTSEERKSILISIKGGKCTKCGHSNPASLTFLQESDCSFVLNSRNLANRSLTLLIDEANKSELLCLNCKAEMFK